MDKTHFISCAEKHFKYYNYFAAALKLISEDMNTTSSIHINMIYSLDADTACSVGINAALVYHILQSICSANKACNNNFHDGNWWFKCKNKAFKQIIPFLTDEQIKGAIKRLVDAGLIEKGVYNERIYDHTLSYAIKSFRYV